MTNEYIPVTEQKNERSINIDKMSPYEIARIINEEDKTVPYAVERELDKIAKAIEIIANALRNSGRLIYIGSGTSGRLGVIDAAECPPTFGVDHEMVQGLIAGGIESMVKACESAEDNYEQGVEDLKQLGFCERDVCFGITASGSTKYVLGAVDYANKVGAYTIGLCCNENTELSRKAKLTIAPIVGPEVIAGSTRMKAASAQKLVLTTISTGVMVCIGRTYGNRMVFLKTTNNKLFNRAVRTVAEIGKISCEEAEKLLIECNEDINRCLEKLEGCG